MRRAQVRGRASARKLARAKHRPTRAGRRAKASFGLMRKRGALCWRGAGVLGAGVVGAGGCLPLRTARRPSVRKTKNTRFASAKYPFLVLSLHLRPESGKCYKIDALIVLSANGQNHFIKRAAKRLIRWRRNSRLRVKASFASLGLLVLGQPAALLLTSYLSDLK